MKRKDSLTSALISFLVVICITLSLSCGIFAEPTATAEEAPLILVADGKSDYVIVVGEETWGKSPTETQKGESILGGEYQAALDLSMYIKNMTGVEIPVRKDTEVAITDNEKVIVVGKTNREATGKITVDRAALGEGSDKDGFMIKTVGNTLYIIGSRPRGTGFAVYELLEKYFGCRFYTYELETYPEDIETLTLEPIENYTYVPFFEARFLSSLGGKMTPAIKTAAKANAHSTSGEVYGGNYAFSSPSGDSNFVHTINRFMGVDYHYYDDTYVCTSCGTEYNQDDIVAGTSTTWKKAPNSQLCTNPSCTDPQVKGDMDLHQWNIYDFKEYECSSCGTVYKDLDLVGDDDVFWRNAPDTQTCTKEGCPDPKTKREMKRDLTRKIDTHAYIASSFEPSDRVRFQACFTAKVNPFTGEYGPDRVLSSVRDWLKGSIIDRGRKNDRQLALSQFDASWQYGGCECKSCVAMENLYEAASGNWIWLCNYVAKRIKNEYSMVKINTLSYLYTNEAPKNIKAEDNVSVFVCTNDYCAAHPFSECGTSLRYGNISDMTKRVSEWQNVSEHLIGYDYYRSNSDYRWIYPVTYQIYYNYKWYRDLGFDGMYSYMQDTQDGFMGLNAYLACKMMWNPEMSIEEYQALIDDYCNAIFGAAGTEMSEVVKAYHEHSTSQDICWGMCTRDNLSILPSSTVYTDDGIICDYTFVNKVQALFDSAFEKTEGDSFSTEKIERQYVGFLYYKLLNLHEIYEYYPYDDYIGFDLPDTEAIEAEIFATADALIKLLKDYKLDSIGIDSKTDTRHKIDLSEADSFDRMAYPYEW